MGKQAYEILVGAEAVAEFLGWHVNTLRRYVAKYPPGTAHVNGRWRVEKAAILAWHAFVLRQESRYPLNRRRSPEEPPEVAEIRGRETAEPVKRRKGTLNAQ